MRFTIFQESRKGQRKVNQDRLAYTYSRDTLLLVVADGLDEAGDLHQITRALDGLMQCDRWRVLTMSRPSAWVGTVVVYRTGQLESVSAASWVARMGTRSDRLMWT